MKKRRKNFLATKLGRVLAILVAAAMVATLVIPAFAEEKNPGTTYVYMTEPSLVEFSAKVGEEAKAEDFEWYLGDRKVSDWKKWSMKTGDFTGASYITMPEKPVVEAGVLKAKFKFDLLFDTTDLSQRRPFNIRLAYPKQIGDYELKAVHKESEESYSKPLTIRPYPSYRSYDEIQQEIQKIKAAAAKGRYVEIEQYGTSVNERPLYFAIIAENKEEVERYLKETTPLMLNDPMQLLSRMQEKKEKHKQVILMNNIHPDEQPAVDMIVKLFETFATQKQVSYQTTSEAGVHQNRTVSMDELLKDYILILSFTMNPDGLADNTRANANGFDLNRDNGYQTQPETRAISQLTVKYHPTIFIDYHGFVKEFLIEPCTPPHEPNYETDLLLPLLLENAHTMGRAGVASSKYEDYIIPMLDYESGWDDATSAYTPMFAMFHGALGHTIEIPEMNEESFKLGVATGYAIVDFAMEHKMRLFENKLHYYQRGLSNTDDRKADAFLVNTKGEAKGRPRKGQENFFPEYYLIPMGEQQKNPAAAYEMIEYFERNGVKVSQLKEDKLGWKKGDAVIEMRQAKRGFINHLLYSGVDESEWPEMYAEIVMNMPQMRGFDVSEIRQKDAFKGALTEYKTEKPISSLSGEGEFYIVENNSNEAVKAVNKALAEGEEVFFVENQGFAMKKSLVESLSKDFMLKFGPAEKKPYGKKLKTPSLFVEGSAAFKLAMKSLGFESAEKAEDADIIATDSSSFDPELLGTKPLIVVGGRAAAAIEKSGKLPGFDVETTDFSHEGLLKAKVTKTGLSTGYGRSDVMYTVSGSWIEKYPESFKALVQAEADDSFFIAGWWPGHGAAKGKVLAVFGKVQGQPTVIFTGNLANKLHPQHLYRWMSNAVYLAE